MKVLSKGIWKFFGGVYITERALKTLDDETIENLRELSKPDYDGLEMIPATPIEMIVMGDKPLQGKLPLDDLSKQIKLRGGK